MANYLQRKVMEKLRTQWLTAFTKEVNEFRVKKGKQPIQITDCITITFYLFNFHPPGLPKEQSKETGALKATFENLECPPEPLQETERAHLHKLVDTLKMKTGFSINDIKDISATLNFKEWSIQANVTLKNGSKDSQIWK